MSSGVSLRRVEDFISPAYLEEQRVLHAAPRGYGDKGRRWANAVAELAHLLPASSILDYGSGKGTLLAALTEPCMRFPPQIRLAQYDPAVPAIAALPSFADLVVCTDVLEHIEPDRLPAVLGHLHLLARKAVFVAIATRPSNKTMRDGRNAHLIVQSVRWWTQQLTAAGFTVSISPHRDRQHPDRECVAVLTL